MKDFIQKRFLVYKNLGDKTFTQLNTEDFLWKHNEESNSIAVIIKHIVGNMHSRWTHFLTEDGEKSWRHRDGEFMEDVLSKEQILKQWTAGWTALFDALQEINEKNLQYIITIRGEKLTVFDALLRQLAHYAYHVGQIVYIAKMRKGSSWETLSIAKNKSAEYNALMKYELPADNANESASPVCFAKSPEIRDEYKTK